MNNTANGPVVQSDSDQYGDTFEKTLRVLCGAVQRIDPNHDVVILGDGRQFGGARLMGKEIRIASGDQTIGVNLSCVQCAFFANNFNFRELFCQRTDDALLSRTICFRLKVIDSLFYIYLVIK